MTWMRGSVRRALAMAAVAVLVLGALVTVDAGAAAAATGTFATTATLDGRTVKDLANHAYINKYPSGTSVTVKCQDSGPNAYGSTVWDLTTDDLWITDYFVRTGYSGFDPTLSRCPGGAASDGSGTFTVTATLDGRTAKDLNNHAYPNRYPTGVSIGIRCQDNGPVAYGSSVWDFTTDNLWVTDRYVRTGYDGFDSALARCTAQGLHTANSYLATVTLDGRTVKDLSNHAYPNKYAAGSFVTITCQDTGQYAYGSVLWDKTSDNLWVADAYIRTGYVTKSPDIPWCSDTTQGTPSGLTFMTTDFLDGRTLKDLSNHAYPNKYPLNTLITITCQAYGGYTYNGSWLWDKTSDGLWVVDYYVKTGSSGFIQGLNRCDNDQPTGGPAPSGGTHLPPPPPVGGVASSQVRNAIVAAAKGQIGVPETGNDCNPYGRNSTKVCGIPWCSIFASWTWRQAGIDVYYPYSGDFDLSYGRAHGTVHDTPYAGMQPGDVILYGTNPVWPNSVHVGVIVAVNSSGQIETVEGNWSAQVTFKSWFTPSTTGTRDVYGEHSFAIVSP